MTTTTTATPAILSLFSRPTFHPPPPHTFLPPNSFPKRNPRLRISYKAAVSSKRGFWVGPCCCSGISGIDPGTSSDKDPSINIQLPRRSLLVQFTCDSCGERTKRLINRLAYERGTVFVQCSGCLQHHKLVDNLGLVVEYDFRKDSGED